MSAVVAPSAAFSTASGKSDAPIFHATRPDIAVSYSISKNWNASFAVEFIGRWFDRNSFGFFTNAYEIQPIATVEYVVPAEWLGGERNAALLGRPALDLQSSYLKTWSNAPGGGFE